MGLMNGKQVLDSLDFNDDRFLHHKVYAEITIRPFEEPWPEFGMNTIGNTQYCVRDIRMNEMTSVPSVRVRVLRGGVFWTQIKDRP